MRDGIVKNAATGPVGVVLDVLFLLGRRGDGPEKVRLC